jgi:ADP-ribose pyrophosphatase YjhB (NUDIX family)
MAGAADALQSARRLRAIAQTGLAYTKDPYDRQRFDEVAAIAAELLARLTGEPIPRIDAMYLHEKGYPTPKVDVRAGVFREDGHILLVREASDGRWALPGGWADEQETPRQACEREVLEESGHVVRALKLAALKDRTVHPYAPARLEHVYKLLFVCEWQSRVAHVAGETTAAAFFARDALPELSQGRTLAGDIELLWRHRCQPALPCYFD